MTEIIRPKFARGVEQQRRMLKAKPKLANHPDFAPAEKENLASLAAVGVVLVIGWLMFRP